jgi:hypothetical protein
MQSAATVCAFAERLQIRERDARRIIAAARRVFNAGVAYHNNDDDGVSERRYAEEHEYFNSLVDSLGFCYVMPGLWPVIVLPGGYTVDIPE